MFEGSVSEQLHQFLTPRTTTPTPNSSSLPLPLNFAPHHPPNLINFHHPFFDAYNITNPLHPHLLHSPNPHQNNGGGGGNDEKPDATPATTTELHAVAMDLEVGRESNNDRSILMDDHHHQHHQHHWSNDELLALLRIRSNMDNCFPESTNWEHVSRKLGEVGFRRTAEKCKEKFEEESRYFNHINYNKVCRFPTHELNYPPPPHHHQHQDQDHDHDHHHLLFPVGNEKPDDPSAVGAPEAEEEEENGENFGDRDEEGEDGKNEMTTTSMKKRQNRKRRKMMRQKEFEILKAYCEDIVKKMMVQQEEIHSKLLHDMLKREEEKVAKEDSWKKQQMERLHKELEVMAHEQAMAGVRQATIIEILNQITNSTPFSSSQAKKELQNLLQSLNNNDNATNYNNSPSSSSLIQTQTNSSPNKNQEVANLASSSSLMAALPPHENSSSFTSQTDPKNPYSSTKILAPQDPNSNPPPASLQKLPQNPKTRDHKELLDDLGKRWPRDEVLALVNVRCSLYNNGGGGGGGGGGGDQDQSGGGGGGGGGGDQGASSKAPLWERISQGMLQLGYKRSAKRCKEKWENINKYFRKTKDVNKKRSLDSRTCPYFHQLSSLYNQGGGTKRPENCPIVSPENHSDQSENLPNSSQRNAC